jgi:hypothetical protein
MNANGSLMDGALAVAGAAVATVVDFGLLAIPGCTTETFRGNLASEVFTNCFYGEPMRGEWS